MSSTFPVCISAAWIARTGDGLDAVVQLPSHAAAASTRQATTSGLKMRRIERSPTTRHPPATTGENGHCTGPIGRNRPHGEDESDDSPGTVTTLMIEIGTSGWPWRASGIAIGTALAAEADGAHVVWFADRIPVHIAPEVWTAVAGPLLPLVPDPGDLADPVVTASAALLVTRTARV